MSDIRVLTADDLPTVAALFQRTFRDPGLPAPRSLQDYLDAIFLHHPWQDPEISSRVHVGADGVVNGFIGVLPLRLSEGGRHVRAGVAGSLMVANPKEDPLAGARLMRAFLTGPQDISLSETANAVSYRMWTRLGASSVPGFSMDFIRVLRPAGLAVALGAERTRAAKAFRPLAGLLDRAALAFRGNPFRPEPADGPPVVGRLATEDEFVPHLLRLAEAYPLHPEWDAETAHWFLDHAQHKEKHGDLRRRLVFDRKGELLGCSLYYGRPGGIAWVLQMMAQPAAADRLVDDLIADAAELGCVGVRGRVQPAFLEPLLRRKALLFQRSATLVHSADRGLLELVRNGQALATGLAGESWIRLVGGQFA